MTYDLPELEVSGTFREMGQQYGEELAFQVAAFVAQRLNAARSYLEERNGPQLNALTDAGQACLTIAERWDPDGTAEHMGIAEGAGVDPARLYTAANMTDVRDVVLLGESSPDVEGCTALLLPPNLTADGQVMWAQTWDLNPVDLDFIVAVHRRPSSGPRTWSITCAGCLSLMGMNERGVAVGTTNIKVSGSKPGVGYLSLLHRALREETYSEAAELIATAPRAGAHTYFIADGSGGVELECSSDRVARRELRRAPVIQTNHCLDPALQKQEGEAANDSSYARLEFMQAEADREMNDVGRIQALFSDRSRGRLSVSRYPEDEQGTATNACLITVPAKGEVWACRGPADRGQWVKLGFE